MAYFFEGMAEMAKAWKGSTRKTYRHHTIKVTLPTGETFPIRITVAPEAKAYPTFRPGGDALIPRTHTLEMTIDPKRGFKESCLFTHVILPKKGEKGVVPHGWISRVLYSDDGAVNPHECVMADKAPDNIRWGPLLLQLAMAFCKSFGVDWIGLVDGSFVTKCNQKVKLTDYLQRKGSIPFYERHGFITLRRWEDYEEISLRETFSKRKQTSLRLHEQRLKKRMACLSAQPATCPWCRSKTCKTVCAAKTHLESGKTLTKLMDTGDKEACELLETLRDAPCLKDLSTKAMTADLEGDDVPMVHYCSYARETAAPPSPPPPPIPPRKTLIRKSSRAARAAVRHILGAVRRSRRIIRKSRA